MLATVLFEEIFHLFKIYTYTFLLLSFILTSFVTLFEFILTIFVILKLSGSINLHEQQRFESYKNIFCNCFVMFGITLITWPFEYYYFFEPVSSEADLIVDVLKCFSAAMVFIIFGLQKSESSEMTSLQMDRFSLNVFNWNLKRKTYYKYQN